MHVLLSGDVPETSLEIATALCATGIRAEVRDLNECTWEKTRTCLDCVMILVISEPLLAPASIIKLRREQIKVPILVLSEALQPQTCATVLDAGADACQQIPCPTDYLASYLRALVRRRTAFDQKTNIVQAGDLLIDQSKCTTQINGKDLRLTANEYKLLLLLALRQGTYVTRTDISRFLHDHDDHFPNSNVPEVHIAKIRRKVRDMGEHNPILTVYSVGYTIPNSASI